MKKVEFIIFHDGKEWVVSNGVMSLSDPTLVGLDAKICGALKREGIVKPGERARIRMAFDMGTMPQWIRQYSQHYFNRDIIIEGEEDKFK